ncbi:endo alpha-1,4 polygalactosaminidase [Kutzneria albida]|uniref:Secreted protein n=1 Tax=Kutzneria albida DSM 43870 TaxID=1449976 RepID=W5W973_9PSEU|nr:endo alpha-1,4 polygalactosaminidase [Kutzneria albida]AHH97295.1 secreted protein [Kutzneria albida DSM 43870]
MDRRAALLSTSTVIAVGLLAGCSPSTQPPAAPTAPLALPGDARFDYQLGGAYPPPYGTQLVVRDSTATPAAGLYNICYVNGFQSQPADRRDWLEQRRDLVVNGVDGQPLVDEKWPEELILDTSTEAKRKRLVEVVERGVKVCAQKGFRAVEIDNLDSYSRSGGQLRAEDNLALATALAQVVHANGMAIGQKNAAEFSAKGKQAGFDFAVAEECVQFQECGSYTEVYGDHVIDIEYTDNLDGEFSQVCGRPGTPKATILRDRKLVAAGDPAHVYQRCH